MTDGQVVLIYTERLGGGPQAWDLFYVAEADPTKAEELVRQGMAVTADQEVKAVHPIPSSVLKFFALNDGQWVHWKSSL